MTQLHFSYDGHAAYVARDDKGNEFSICQTTTEPAGFAVHAFQPVGWKRENGYNSYAFRSTLEDAKAWCETFAAAVAAGVLNPVGSASVATQLDWQRRREEARAREESTL